MSVNVYKDGCLLKIAGDSTINFDYIPKGGIIQNGWKNLYNYPFWWNTDFRSSNFISDKDEARSDYSGG